MQEKKKHIKDIKHHVAIVLKTSVGVKLFLDYF